MCHCRPWGYALTDFDKSKSQEWQRRRSCGCSNCVVLACGAMQLVDFPGQIRASTAHGFRCVLLEEGLYATRKWTATLCADTCDHMLGGTIAPVIVEECVSERIVPLAEALPLSLAAKAALWISKSAPEKRIIPFVVPLSLLQHSLMLSFGLALFRSGALALWENTEVSRYLVTTRVNRIYFEEVNPMPIFFCWKNVHSSDSICVEDY